MSNSNIWIGKEEAKPRKHQLPDDPPDPTVATSRFWERGASILAVIVPAVALVGIVLGLAFNQDRTNRTLLEHDAEGRAKFETYDKRILERTEARAKFEARVDMALREHGRRMERVENKTDKVLELLYQIRR